MREIRAPFLFYLINDLGFTRAECEKVWKAVNKHFPNESSQLTLEVLTRDVLQGENNETVRKIKELIK